MQLLRDPETGCPWDVKQTPETIVRYTLEEVHEVVDAIEKGDWSAIQEELG
ncbi:MAG: MazG nucleotide pyrophosphohydrolase domain-containing protein, partial [Gammaproteobacteria bacterium]